MRDLEIQLKRLNGQNFGRYKTLHNTWKSGGIRCKLNHIQGDPYAPLSSLSVKIPMEETKIPEDYYSNPIKAKALADFMYRRLVEIVDPLSAEMGDGNSGLIHIDPLGPEVMGRSAVQVKAQEVEIRLGVGLPGERRKILGQEAIEILTFKIPEIWTQVAYWRNLNQSALRDHIKVVEDQQVFRSQLEEHNLVAWVQDGSILARSEGHSSAKMDKGAVSFVSPKSLQVSLLDSQGQTVVGMGIPKGLTLIAGGGFHGKSTLLHALENGIYDHIPGDGREGVVSQRDSMKVRSEEGRHVHDVNLSAFIGSLPNQMDSQCFSSNNASGSTSQFANLLESIEAGSSTFFIDEDLSAVNALVRDERMQQLLEDYSEPIVPLIDRMELMKSQDLNFVMVIGASGVYLDQADTVIVMKDFQAHDASELSRQVIAELPSRRVQSDSSEVQVINQRIPNLLDIHSRLKGLQRWPKIKVQGTKISINDIHTFCQGFDQIQEVNQYKMMANSVVWMVQKHPERNWTINELLKHWKNTFSQGGFDSIQGVSSRDLSEVRAVDVACFLNRLYGLKIQKV